VAADCQIERPGGDACGIEAVGRCRRPNCAVPGGAAFCRSHCDDPVRGTVCSPCLEADQRRQTEAAAAVTRDLDREVDRVRRLATALIRAGVRPDRKFFHASARTTRTGLFGRGRTVDVEEPDRHGYGWHVGRYEWVVDKPIEAYHHQPGHVVALRSTFVTADGRLACEGSYSPSHYPADILPCIAGESGAPYPYTAGGYATSSMVASRLGSDRTVPEPVDLWRSVADALAEIARRHGVQEPTP
jgi:hypothetical protein